MWPGCRNNWMHPHLSADVKLTGGGGGVLGLVTPSFRSGFNRSLECVTDRRNRAGDDRHNEATRSGTEPRFRTDLRMLFFARFCNGVFAIFRHWFGLAEAFALDH